MFQILKSAAIVTIVPKLMDKIGDSLVNVYDSVFGHTKEVEKMPRKKSDTTKFTQEMAVYIRTYHSLADQLTGQQQTKHLNEKFGLHKSRAAYTRIWHPDFDISTLPKGGNK